MFKEPGEPSFGEQEKSPEELRFEELLNQGIHLPLEGSDEFESYDDPGKEPNLRDDFYLSGNPEKIAIFNMLEAKDKLDFFAAKLRVRGDKKDKRADKQLKELKDVLNTTLSDVGLETPQNYQDAGKMRDGFCTFENWQKIKQAIENRQKEE
jgi:hypothetical protein